MKKCIKPKPKSNKNATLDIIIHRSLPDRKRDTRMQRI